MPEMSEIQNNATKNINRAYQHILSLYCYIKQYVYLWINRKLTLATTEYTYQIICKYFKHPKNMHDDKNCTFPMMSTLIRN